VNSNTDIPQIDFLYAADYRVNRIYLWAIYDLIDIGEYFLHLFLPLMEEEVVEEVQDSCLALLLFVVQNVKSVEVINL
jgi:hypothetical protein